jgi:dihydroorotate dehydrogenase electron transfer subunit
MSGSTLTSRSDLEIEVGLAAPEPGPRTLAPFGRRLCRVLANEQAGSYRLVGVEDPDAPSPLPGQFYMLAACEGWGESQSQRPYLARAFSVCRVRGERLDFLVEAIGPGTRRLATLAPGEGLWLVGPLGVGFSAPSVLSPHGERASAVLLGGGAGVAPLVIWQEALRETGTACTALLGFRSASHCEVARLFSGDVAIATDDGSAGHRGLVTELLVRELEQGGEQVVYACGPPAMLEEVRRISCERSVAAELAMEEAMACGFGACFGCAVRTKTGYRRLCVDGPVIAAADLDEGWTG